MYQQLSVGIYCNLLSIALLFLLAQVKCQSATNIKNGIMVPNVKERVIQSGSTFVVTCMFEHTAVSIEWKLPEYLALHKELSKANERLSIQKDRNNTHVTTTLTVIGARPRDTGTYNCYLPSFPQQKVEQYIYVYSNFEPIFLDDTDRLVFPHGGVGKVPCKPTHPNISIILQRTNLLNIDQIPKNDLQRDLLDNKEKWLSDPKSGLLITKVKLDDFGSYQCLTENKTKGVPFKIVVSGVELTRIDNQEDPMDGDNVTLLCRAYLFPSPPEWNYLDIETGKTHSVNVTHVPKGLTGVRIETEKVQATGEKMPAFRSRLFLTNVSMDTPTNFGCTATGNEGETKISEERFSFKINDNLAFE